MYVRTLTCYGYSGADIPGSASARLLIVAACLLASCDPEVPAEGQGTDVVHGSYPVGYGLGMMHTPSRMTLTWLRKRSGERRRRSRQYLGSFADRGCVPSRIM
eukprot:6141812-Prymnesium_polylepis.1